MCSIRKYFLKINLFIQNISCFLQKLCNYEKNLKKHKTKINTEINTN